MADKRIMGLPTEQTAGDDDFLAIDSLSKSTRKIRVSDLPSGGGGGGSTVIPNPIGEPTDTLNTIGINNIIYDIPGSGGGGSSQTIADVLWSGAETPTAGSPYTAVLSKSIENYDFVIVDSFENNGGTQMQLLLPVNDIQYNVFYSKSHYNTACYMRFTDASHAEFGMFTSTNLTTYTKVTGLKFCGTLAPMIYSTEEREVGVWVDDKPLYCKTWEFETQLVVSSQSFTTTDISNSEMERIIDAYGGDQNGTSWDNLGANCNDSGGYVQLHSSRNTVIEIKVLTLFYTKTADTPGSGKYNTLGVPTHHYDDAEKIIGTWFGETLYEKSYALQSPITITGGGEWINTGIDISFVDRIIKCDFSQGGSCWNAINAINNSGVLAAVIFTGRISVGVDAITIQYTKTSS